MATAWISIPSQKNHVIQQVTKGITEKGRADIQNLALICAINNLRKLVWLNM